MGILSFLHQIIFKNKRISKTGPDISKLCNIESQKKLDFTTVDFSSSSQKSNKIMIIDDDEDWNKLLTKILQKEDYKIETYRNAENVFDKVKESKPSLILMDIKMPSINGFEATQIIKKHFTTNKVPVIMLTSDKSDFAKIESMKAGARCVLAKDSPIEDIIYAVKQYMLNPNLKHDIHEKIARHHHK